MVRIGKKRDETVLRAQIVGRAKPLDLVHWTIGTEGVVVTEMRFVRSLSSFEEL